TELYVDMALQYLRLDSDSSDFILKKYSLDHILKQALREYSGMFIRKRIALDYRETGISVITDEKWLLFVIGQILSNALKYTDSGKISIYIQKPDEAGVERPGTPAAETVLVIEDTGIGIAPRSEERRVGNEW